MSLKALLFFSFAILSFSNSFAGIELDLHRKKVSWIALRNLTPQDYQAKLTSYKAKGFRPQDIEISVGGSKRYAITMVKEKRSWALHTSLNSSQFNSKWTKYKNTGFRLIDQESYVHAGKRFYAGLWIKNKEKIKWLSHRNQSLSSFASTFTANKNRGFMPVDVEAYLVNKKLMFSSVWVKNKGYSWKLTKKIPASKINSYLANINQEGKRIIDFNSYLINGIVFYGVISIKDKKRVNWKYRLVKSLKNQPFKNKSFRLRDQGFRIDAYDVLRTRGGNLYSALYSLNNSERYNWSKKKKINTLSKNWYQTAVPAGVSVAIAHNGQLRYMRSFGFSDIKKGVTTHSKTVYRLASISKAITGTLGFRLEDMGKINLNANVTSNAYLKSLPSLHNGYTLGDLLTNRSLVKHYSTSDAINNGGQFNKAWDAVKLFMNWTRTLNDPDGYLYSTPGYTLFAAAVERKTGKNYCTWINQQIKLSSIRCEKQNRSTKEKSQIYVANSSGKPVVTSSPRNISWKYAGGGLEGSSYDLSRFGMRLLNGTYMSKSRREKMTTDTLDGNKSYAYGWNYGSHDNLDWFAKSGAQRGARTYMRIYPDKNLVIVMLANLWTTTRLENTVQAMAKDILK